MSSMKRYAPFVFLIVGLFSCGNDPQPTPPKYLLPSSASEKPGHGFELQYQIPERTFGFVVPDYYELHFWGPQPVAVKAWCNGTPASRCYDGLHGMWTIDNIYNENVTLTAAFKDDVANFAGWQALKVKVVGGYFNPLVRNQLRFFNEIKQLKHYRGKDSTIGSWRFYFAAGISSVEEAEFRKGVLEAARRNGVGEAEVVEEEE